MNKPLAVILGTAVIAGTFVIGRATVTDKTDTPAPTAPQTNAADRLAEVNKEMAALNNKVSKLNEDLKAANDKIVVLDKDLKTANGKNDDLKAQLAAAITERETLKAQLTAMTKERDELKEALRIAQSAQVTSSPMSLEVTTQPTATTVVVAQPMSIAAQDDSMLPYTTPDGNVHYPMGPGHIRPEGSVLVRDLSPERKAELMASYAPEPNAVERGWNRSYQAGKDVLNTVPNAFDTAWSGQPADRNLAERAFHGFGIVVFEGFGGTLFRAARSPFDVAGAMIVGDEKKPAQPAAETPAN